jgi:hypothetical protein
MDFEEQCDSGARLECSRLHSRNTLAKLAIADVSGRK